MPCQACIEGKKRRQQRLEALRKHHAERRAQGQQSVQVIKPQKPQP